MTKHARSIDLQNTNTLYYAPASASTAVELIHVSGQVGPMKSGKVPACYESQIHLALLNLRKVLLTAGAAIADITKLTIYIVNYDPKRRLHTKHIQRFLQGYRPAITLVPIAQFAVAEWLFEIDAVVAKTVSRNFPLTPSLRSEVKQTVDVIIVGAGLSGLASAREVVRAGLSCLVLEARDRVGGKTWSVQLPSGDGVIDLGAAWINDSNQSHVHALAKEFDIELIQQNTTGSCVLQDFNGTCSPFPYGDLPQVSPAYLIPDLFMRFADQPNFPRK